MGIRTLIVGIYGHFLKPTCERDDWRVQGHLPELTIIVLKKLEPIVQFPPGKIDNTRTTKVGFQFQVPVWGNCQKSADFCAA